MTQLRSQSNQIRTHRLSLESRSPFICRPISNLVQGRKLSVNVRSHVPSPARVRGREVVVRAKTNCNQNCKPLNLVQSFAVNGSQLKTRRGRIISEQQNAQTPTIRTLANQAKQAGTALIDRAKSRQPQKRPIRIRSPYARQSEEGKQKSSGRSDSQYTRPENDYFIGIQFFRELGRGSQAVVKSAVDWNRNRKIAVKFYSRKQLTAKEMGNVEREATVLKLLSHQNIAALYDVVYTPKAICLIMEYGGGNSLFQYLKSVPRCQLSEEDAKQILRQVLSCVQYIHDMDVVHRDIKPENILLNKHKQVKLIDFGYAVRQAPGTLVQTYCGTPTYMAPEVVSKTPHVGMYADRWSLGVLVFTLLQGTYPFKGQTEKELFRAIGSARFSYVREVSQGAQEVIGRLIVRDPRSRASPAEVLGMEWFR